MHIQHRSYGDVALVFHSYYLFSGRGLLWGGVEDREGIQL